jgi:hypothetical protein
MRGKTLEARLTALEAVTPRKNTEPEPTDEELTLAMERAFGIAHIPRTPEEASALLGRSASIMDWVAAELGYSSTRELEAALAAKAAKG